jgi:hypothetical protein
MHMISTLKAVWQRGHFDAHDIILSTFTRHGFIGHAEDIWIHSHLDLNQWRLVTLIRRYVCIIYNICHACTICFYHSQRTSSRRIAARSRLVCSPIMISYKIADEFKASDSKLVPSWFRVIRASVDATKWATLDTTSDPPMATKIAVRLWNHQISLNTTGNFMPVAHHFAIDGSI